MKNILVLTDFSAMAEHAAEVAWSIADKMKAELILYNSYYVPSADTGYGGMFPTYYGDYAIFEQNSCEHLRFQATRLKQKFEKPDGPVIHCQNGVDSLSENIHQLLKNQDTWMIVMGDKRSDGFFSWLFLGSHANKLLRKVNRPVLMIPEKASLKDLKKIAFGSAALDQTDQKALNFLVELAEPYGAEILVVHVMPQDATEQEMSRLPEVFNTERLQINYPKISFHHLKSDEVIKTLLDFAQQEDIDIISLAHKRHSLYEQLLHGSITKEMMDFHALPLLVFPASY